MKLINPGTVSQDPGQLGQLKNQLGRLNLSVPSGLLRTLKPKKGLLSWDLENMGDSDTRHY